MRVENGIWRDLRTEYKEEIMERHIIIGAPYKGPTVLARILLAGGSCTQ